LVSSRPSLSCTCPRSLLRKVRLQPLFVFSS
jgi:hypothetical protein